MANPHLRDGFAGYCTLVSGGTGPYTGITDIAGFRSFRTLNDNDVAECSVRTATGFENGKYTKGGGATPSLARAPRIFNQFDGSTNPVNWAAGTQVLIHSGLSAGDVASITGENEFENHQHLKANHLTLTADKLTYLYGPSNGLAAFVVGGAYHTALGLGSFGEPYLGVYHADSGAGSGPGINLDRNSASQAANDVMGYLNFSGRDDAGNYTTYVFANAHVISAVNGAESGGFNFQMPRAGASVLALDINPFNIIALPNFHDSQTSILVGKFAPSLDQQGVELRCDGAIVATTIALEPMILNRRNTDGMMVSVFRDGFFEGGMRVDAHTVSIQGAGLSHHSLWDPRPPFVPRRGALLCSTERVVDDASGIHPFARLCTEESDPAVYGVYGGKTKVQLRDRSKHGGLLVQATGAGAIQVVGPVEHGQLLEGSNLPGVARAQASRAQRDGTVAKARASVPAGQRRLIPCTLMAG